MAKHKHYTKEEVEWVVNNAAKSNDWSKVAAAFKEEFKHSRSNNSLRSLAYRKGVKLRERSNYNVYTEEQEEWLKKYSKKLNMDTLTRFFNAYFKKDVSETGMTQKCIKLGLDWKKKLGYEKGKAIQIDPVGTIKKDTRGAYKIKVANPGKWEKLSIYMWKIYNNNEDLNGRIVIFLDKDNSNFRKDNLIALERAEMVRINADYTLTDNVELNKTSVLLGKLRAAAFKGGRNGDSKLDS